MRFPVSRRALLTVGVSGAGLGLLSACGLRLDNDPDVPTLDSTQQLRNRISRILASTTPGSGDPETAGEDLAAFTKAIGPEWNPPSELATEPAPTEEDRTFVEAAEAVSQAVFEASSQLGSGLIPVLADVATGMTLVAGEKKPELVTTAAELIRDGADEASDKGKGSGKSEGSDTDDASTEDDARTKVFNAILDQSRAAAYGYERLAVHLESKSAEREGALARLESLGSLSGQMLEALGEAKADPNASAWKLDPSPTDAQSAKELALGLEDGLASALLPWLDGDTSAVLRLWESAKARAIFARSQPLRYEYGEAGQAEAKK
ncbi:hypothetical protein [Brevibacterium atlanticum]|uniref:hypothetical protein n=1 Tax=Brevibacterium atlanticum TaxID=2697563 RepID=UPI0014206592|nr:hypothetical protein [Brevibacterium atlanticum]